ncbi:MAG: hypothetical protein U0871_06635 [Gemmataceae bacterium]
METNCNTALAEARAVRRSSASMSARRTPSAWAANCHRASAGGSATRPDMGHHK